MQAERQQRKLCCVNCFCIDEIQRFVSQFDQTGNCDYCGSRNVPTAEVAEVGEFISDCVLKKYEDAVESVPYDSSEGGYLFPTHDIWEMLCDIEAIFADDPSELIDDLVHPDGTLYVIKHYPDPLDPPWAGAEDITSWQQFSDLVKGKRRFTSFWESPKPTDGEKAPFSGASDTLTPRGFLEETLRRAAARCLRELQPGEKVYRARITSGAQRLKHPDLTSPPPDSARAGRMNPPGISLFYGGLDEATCVAEVRPSIGETVAVAEFLVLRNLRVLDLSSLVMSRKVCNLVWCILRSWLSSVSIG